MRSALLVLLAMMIAAAAISAQPGTASRYIGYKYKGVLPLKTLPNGVKHMGGSLIGDIEADPVYGISTVERGRTKMLWLEASTGKDSKGVTGWRVLDVLSFPGFTKADYLFFVGDPAIGCRRNGNELLNLVGIGRLLRREAIFKPSKLWVADIESKKFQAITIAGVKCEYSEP